MAEHFRTEYERTEEKFQWCDTEAYQVFDIVTGKPYDVRSSYFSNSDYNSKYWVTYEEAKEFVIKHRWWNRTIIVKVDCIFGFEIKEKQHETNGDL